MRKAFGGIFFAGLFFLAVGTAWGAAFHPYKGWRTLQTPHFALHFHSSLESVAQKSAGYFEEAYEALTPKYEWKPWGRTQVILTDNFDDSNGMATTLPYNWILLRVVPPAPESSLGFYDDWLKTLITHEFTHILHLDAYGGFWKFWHLFLGKMIAPAGLTPSWIKEGAATLEETQGTDGGRGRSAYGEMLVRTAVLNHQFPTIDRAAGVHWSWPAAQLPYIFGVKFLDYLRETYGEEKLQKFHRGTQRSIWIGAVNHNAKKVFGKNFYKLWREWRESLEKKYGEWEEGLNKKGVTPTELFLGGKDSLYLPTFSRDGKKLAYVATNPRKAPALYLRDLETGKVIRLARKVADQMTFSPDGNFLVFSAPATYKRFYSYYDLFRIDLKTRKIKRLTMGERARDPDFSPDGSKIVFTASRGGTDTIKIYDVASKKITALAEAPEPFTQFANLRYSPDGSKFALVRFMNKEGWEVCVYSAEGKFLKCVTNNGLAVELRPAWTSDGKSILFSSDLDGVFNLYSYEWKSGKTRRLTQVTTGIFQPTPSPDGKMLLARYYHGKGYDIRRVIIGSGTIGGGSKKSAGAELAGASPSLRGKLKTAKRGAAPFVGVEPPQSRGASAKAEFFRSSSNGSHSKYQPIGGSLLLPRYVIPGFLALDNGLLLSGATGSYDPLRYHHWIAGATYRTDARHVGYFGTYTYNRFLPTFGGGIDDSAVDYGIIRFLNVTTNVTTSYHFYEERRQGYVFASTPLWGNQAFGVSYFYEDRTPITGIRANEAALLNLGVFAGLNMTYVYGSREAYPGSISPTEKGRRLKLVGTVTDERLGANARNEQRIFSGDYREYIPMGKNHVLALRMAGGTAVGDRVTPGTFSLGGSLGEGTLAGSGSSRYFSLRGLPISTLVRDRVMLMSAEYRLPLVSPQRGPGTWPIFLNNLHMGFFTDIGDAWDAGDNSVLKESFRDFFDDFFLGVGLEARADLVIGHGLPVTGRLGYGVIVLNRDRLGTLKDPLVGNLVKNGILIMQWGTSF